MLSLILLTGILSPANAQVDNRFEVSKNLGIFNKLVKEMEGLKILAGGEYGKYHIPYSRCTQQLHIS